MRAPAHRESERQRNLGTKQSVETREKKRRAMEGRHQHESNPMWKGDGVGYFALHSWVARYKTRTGVCSECGKKGKTDWANVSGEYRRALDDWIELCRRCHYWSHREK